MTNTTCSVVSAGHRCSSISFCTFLAPAYPLAVSPPSPLSAASTVEVSSPTVSVPSISAWRPYHHGSPSPSHLPPASPLSLCYSSSPAAPSSLTKHVRPVPRSLFPSPMQSPNCDALALLWPTLKRLEKNWLFDVPPGETFHQAPRNDLTAYRANQRLNNREQNSQEPRLVLIISLWEKVSC